MLRAWWSRCAGAFASALVIALSPAGAADPAPQADAARASDVPWDAGGAILVEWSVATPQAQLTGWLIERKGEVVGEEWGSATEVPASARAFTATKLVADGTYRFRVMPLGVNGSIGTPMETGAVTADANFFLGHKLPLFVAILIVSACVIVFIVLARKGYPLKIRKIAALDAVDNAVGRATEMGRSVLFIPGIQDMDNISTVAGITVLGHVARTAAEYDATIEVPTSRSLVMEAAREAVQASYLSAGRSDSYNPDLIRYITDEQFGFVAYVSGRMVREKPAACFYMGCFFAESLILSETGNSIGAIQIAGTAESSQLPFFVAACDYTLIGEEFFAASSYLSREPDQMGSLKGQDAAKLITAAVIVIGVVLATLASLRPEGPVPGALAWFKGVLGS